MAMPFWWGEVVDSLGQDRPGPAPEMLLSSARHAERAARTDDGGLAARPGRVTAPSP